MFTLLHSMYIHEKLESEVGMSPVTRVQHKHFRLNHLKIKRVQKLLQTGTETETIERALDLVLDEHERNQAAERANERFLSSRIEIKDVYGKTI